MDFHDWDGQVLKFYTGNYGIKSNNVANFVDLGRVSSLDNNVRYLKLQLDGDS